MMRVARSVHGSTIRLTDERWLHITEEHSELAGCLFDVLATLEMPEAVVEGNMGEVLAYREMGLAGTWWLSTWKPHPATDL